MNHKKSLVSNPSPHTREDNGQNEEADRRVAEYSRPVAADMGKLEYFEILEDRAVFRPAGQVSMEWGVELVATAIAFARARHIRKLLVDTSNLTGFEPPDIARRYFFIHDWARASAGRVHVAFLARPEMIDQQKFGRTVAANAGFIADVFTTEEDALIWLRGLST